MNSQANTIIHNPSENVKSSVKDNTTTPEYPFISNLDATQHCIQNAHRHLTAALAMPFAQHLSPTERHALHGHRNRLYTLRRSIRRMIKSADRLRHDSLAEMGYSLENTIPTETSEKSHSLQSRHPNRSE
ncbi:hypothetical protein ES705_19300 [subsurface metagenome]